MKRFTKLLNRCHNECPDYEYRDFECGGMTCDWCKKYNREIPYKIQTFTEWCKLEDVDD
jgi:hypothetical protein